MKVLGENFVAKIKEWTKTTVAEKTKDLCDSWFEVRFHNEGSVTIDGVETKVPGNTFFKHYGSPSSLVIKGAVTYIDVAHLDTSKMTSLKDALGDSEHTDRDFCSILDVAHWNVGNVTDMSGLFKEYTRVEDLNLYGWDVSKVTDMSEMFNDCYELKSIVSARFWDVSNVKDMHSMFKECYALESFDFSNWDVSNVTDMSCLFRGCENMDGLNLYNWNTSNVTSLADTFYRCINLTEIDVGDWNTSNVEDMTSTFNQCESLTSLNLSNWNTAKVTIMEGMFNGCLKLQELDISGFDMSNVSDTSEMFWYCPELTTLVLGEGVGKAHSDIDFFFLTKWTGESVKTLLNLYDRKANGLNNMPITLHPNTKEALGDEGVAQLKAKGYDISTKTTDGYYDD